MAVGCGAKCAKALLITFNIIFWLSGCALLALGIWILVDRDKGQLFSLVDGDEPIIKYLAYGLVAIGGFVLVVGFFGCCGALQESKCLLVTYFIFLFVVLAAELAVGILAVIYREQLLPDMESKLTEKLQKTYGSKESAFTQAVDYTQFQFSCCGIMKPDDYLNSTWRRSEASQGAIFPQTCCVLNSNDTDAWVKPVPKVDKCGHPDPVGNSPPDGRHQKGCFEAIEAWVKQESALLIGIGLGVAGLEIFGMIFAICLCRNLGEEA